MTCDHALTEQRVTMFLMVVVYGSRDFLVHTLAVSSAIAIKLI
jgi:hypothetical protein